MASFAFDPIVLTGSAAANPHGTSGGGSIVPGACLLIDFGASYGGMHADITRTFFLNSVSDESKNMYDVVLKANQKGREISKPGMSMHDLDDGVTKVLEDSAYKDFIVHKTGHGLGMDVHEDPYVMRKNYELLEKGMVITIEPGLYKDKYLGIRVEDDVLITDKGCKSLTSFDRDIRVI